MLARTVDARTTRDIDLYLKESNLDNAVRELRRLAQIDLCDYLRFEYLKHTDILINRESRKGYRVSFQPFFGVSKKLNQISIDLVIDKDFIGASELITPQSRISLAGLSEVNYRVVPVENHISEKVCAIMAIYNGRESSRIKDFVDLPLLLAAKPFQGSVFQNTLRKELELNGLGSLSRFTIPTDWLNKDYPILVARFREVVLPSEFQNPQEALIKVSGCIDQALENKVSNLFWNNIAFNWESK